MPRPTLTAAVAALAIMFQAGASAAPPGTNSMLVMFCREQWAGDGGMIDYCIKKQVTEYRRAEASGASPAIKSKCKAEYGSDYSMINACIRNESRTSGSQKSQSGGEETSRKNLSTYVNGIKIDVCSSGELCYYQILRPLQLQQ